jgi:protein XagA
MRAWPAALAACVLLSFPASAGAWTLDRGHLQIITGSTMSRATRRFDDNAAPSEKIAFDKLLAQSWMEYGLTDAVTLFAAPEYILANSGSSSGVVHARTSSVEAGLRILLLSRIGMLSVQASGKTAGAFDMSVSAGGESGRQLELRLLYGKSFRLLRRDAFIDIEAAERWIKRPRPNEVTLDATAGLWVSRRYLLLLQSFNTFSDGAALPPYEVYRLHKLQLSLVQRITPRWSFQSGYFQALAGRNIVQERGFIATIWYKT